MGICNCNGGLVCQKEGQRGSILGIGAGCGLSGCSVQQTLAWSGQPLSCRDSSLVFLGPSSMISCKSVWTATSDVSLRPGDWPSHWLAASLELTPPFLYFLPSFTFQADTLWTNYFWKTSHFWMLIPVFSRFTAFSSENQFFVQKTVPGWSLSNRKWW